jgi:hypothetical protein
VVSDIPVDDEAPVVTSGISRFAGAQSFKGAHRGRVLRESPDLPVISPSKVLIGVGFAYVYL